MREDRVDAVERLARQVHPDDDEIPVRQRESARPVRWFAPRPGEDLVPHLVLVADEEDGHGPADVEPQSLDDPAASRSGRPQKLERAGPVCSARNSTLHQSLATDVRDVGASCGASSEERIHASARTRIGRL